MSSTLILDNVFLVPFFNFNLLSVSQLTFSKRHCVIFTNKYCMIQNIASWTIIGLVEVKTGLSLMQCKLFDKMSQRPVVFVSNIFALVCKKILEGFDL